jgi:hypothetical protein
VHEGLQTSPDLTQIAPKATNEPAKTHKRAPNVGGKGSHLAMKEHGQSGLRPHSLDNAPDRSTQQTKTKNKTIKEFSVATYNVRTLNDSTSSQTISHKLLQITNGCEKHKIDVVSIQEHRLKTTNSENINYITLDEWTLAHTNSSHTSHGVALLYNNAYLKRSSLLNANPTV